MDTGESLRAFLLADATIAGLLVSDGMGRIYPDELPQGPTYPAVRYTLISELDNYASQGAVQLTRIRYQIDCYAPRARDARTVARALRDRLRGFKGTMGEHQVQGVFSENARTGREGHVEPPVWVASRDFIIWFED
jgi:hypothetical protein